MKRKVKKYAGKDSSLVEIEERSTKSPSVIAEELGKGPMDYATSGKRAGATPARSTMAGPVEYISESKEDESPRGTASGFKAEKYLEEIGTKGGGSGVRSTTGPAKKKAASKPKYSGVVSAEEMGSQDFTTKSKPAGTGGISKGALAAGLGIAGAAGAGALAARRKMKEGSRQERTEPSMSMSRSPVRNISAEEAAFENEGGKYFKKGGKTTRMASGGSASSRGDGIAQRGKTKGRIC